MTSTLVSSELTSGGASFGVSPFSNASTEASATKTPLPQGTSTGASHSRVLWLTALAHASTLMFFADPGNAATTAGSWARDLGHEEEKTNTPDIGGVTVPHEVPRIQAVVRQAQSAASRAKAYAAFDALFAEGDFLMANAEFPLVAYLSDPESQHRDALLACFADREIELESGALVAAVAQLLTAIDARTRRVAALALASSGSAGEVELGRGLDALSVEWAEDIRSTLKLSA